MSLLFFVLSVQRSYGEFTFIEKQLIGWQNQINTPHSGRIIAVSLNLQLSLNMS